MLLTSPHFTRRPLSKMMIFFAVRSMNLSSNTVPSFSATRTVFPRRVIVCGVFTYRPASSPSAAPVPASSGSVDAGRCAMTSSMLPVR